MSKLRHCPNCKQNVMPKLTSRGGAGCMVFVTCCLVGVLMILVDAEPPTPAILCVAWWVAGFVVMLVMGRGKRICPMCGMSGSKMGKAL